jgi:hypothetical protein
MMPSAVDPFSRRHFILSLSALAALTTGLPLQGQAPVASLPTAMHPPGPATIQVVSERAVAITWAVHGACTGLVEFGSTPQLGQVAHGAQYGLRPLASEVLSIPLHDLAPGQTIYFRTVTAPIAFPNHYAIRRGEAVASQVRSFRLPDSVQERVRLAVWNDTHGVEGTLTALRQATTTFGPDLVILNGDHVPDQFKVPGDLASTFLTEARGVASSRWPTLQVRGNHEARGPLAYELPRYSPPQEGTGYHSLLRLGPVALLTLDTGEDKEGPETYGGLGEFTAYREVQARWLGRAIQEPRFLSAPFRLACCHIPLRWRDADDPGAVCLDGARRWGALLAKAGVQAVISGHTHAFWHHPPTGAQPFHQIVGGGPETSCTDWSPTPATLIRIAADQRKLRLEVVEAASGRALLDLTLGP